MASEATDIVDRAIDWHLRQAVMDEAEWHAFVLWLEADPAHARAFDAVALDLAAVAEHGELFPTPAATVPAQPQPAAWGTRAPSARRTWAWVGAGTAVAAAACLTLVVVPIGPKSGSDPYVVETKPGERQQVALLDGTRIELNGATRLGLDRANPRVATLESGEATFHVRHDANAPFTVRSGAATVQDMGTVFNVERAGERLEVQVAQGSVLYQPTRDAVTLNAGAAITAHDDSGRVVVSKVDVARVGAWREREIVFSDEAFGRISTAIQRIDGTTLIIHPSLSQRPFTGMVRLSGKAEQDVPHIAALIGAEWHHDGERWVISPR